MLLNGIPVSAQQMRDAAGGTGKVRFEPDPAMQRIMDGVPQATSSKRAVALGFRHSANIEEIVDEYKRRSALASNGRALPSRVTVEGLDRAPHRAFLHALGLTDADLQKPFVGVASTDGRVTPCNALLGEFAREACAAVRDAGGVPFDFASISVADSMSMNHGGMRYSLVSREIIADGVEAVVRGHAYDALVTFAGCDKTLPGMMMAMVRLNLPSVFVYGGAALPGRLARPRRDRARHLRRRSAPSMPGT